MFLSHLYNDIQFAHLDCKLLKKSYTGTFKLYKWKHDKQRLSETQ